MSGWFEKPEVTKPISQPGGSEQSSVLPGHSVAENAAAAKEAFDKIQGDYENEADRLQDEFSRHADQAQGLRPKWPE
ncbi:MAG TPA: hypothetical protein VFH06_02585 [Candidatus Saccharimonadales bacterium]|nr:hypothetical protein [Candidatus Saccharimonadales bacterium]